MKITLTRFQTWYYGYSFLVYDPRMEFVDLVTSSSFDSGILDHFFEKANPYRSMDIQVRARLDCLRASLDYLTKPCDISYMISYG